MALCLSLAAVVAAALVESKQDRMNWDVHMQFAVVVLVELDRTPYRRHLLEEPYSFEAMRQMVEPDTRVVVRKCMLVHCHSKYIAVSLEDRHHWHYSNLVDRTSMLIDQHLHLPQDSARLKVEALERQCFDHRRSHVAVHLAVVAADAEAIAPLANWNSCYLVRPMLAADILHTYVDPHLNRLLDSILELELVLSVHLRSQQMKSLYFDVEEHQ